MAGLMRALETGDDPRHQSGRDNLDTLALCEAVITAALRPPRRRLRAHRPTRGLAPMKLGLINSAWAQAGRDTAYGIAQTRAIGFDSIDIFADPLDIDAAERALIKFRS